MELLVGDVFRNAARATPDRVAAALGSQTLTFDEIDRRANRTARVLERRGLGGGERVVVTAATSLDVVPLFAALAKLGAVFAPMNPGLSPEEAFDTASAARPSLLVVDEARSAVGAAVGTKLGCTVETLAELSSSAAGEDDADVVTDGLTENDAHVIFFTSGSTGRPKGVVLTHRVNFLRTHPG